MTSTLGEAGEERHRYAGLVSRTVGLAVDVSVLTVATLAVATLPGLAWQQVVGNPPTWLSVTAGAVAALLPWGYFTGCWWLTGRTGGALLVGVEVTRRDGTRLGAVQAGLRALVGLSLWPIWLGGMLGTLWDPRRRAWHDRLFRTVVLAAPSLGAARSAENPDNPVRVP